ncbi:hypothetical protein Tco_0382864 [Tanacetum coccineum]
METKNTSSSGSVLEEPEIQKLQMQAKIFKENSLNKLNALKSTTQLLERQSILYSIKLLNNSLVDNLNSARFQRGIIIGHKFRDETSSGIVANEVDGKERKIGSTLQFHGKDSEVLPCRIKFY